MAIYQLTGDDRWISPPFRPSRGRGLDDNAGGGYDAETAAAIRDAAVDAVLAWHLGTAAALEQPDLTTMGAMLECFLGQRVPEEYWTMFGVDHGAIHDPADVGDLGEAARRAGMSVAIIGAGLSGMLAAVRLQAAGVPFVIFERSSDIGGVWLQNFYPGAGVDTPSNLYSYSGFPADWSTSFARRDEMLAYLRRFAESHELLERIRFDTSVKSCRWDAETSQWHVDLMHAEGGPETVSARVVISAVGLFNEPAVPDIEGRDLFEGEIFHSARWPAGYDVAGRSVAVVGSGASAMQVVPAIADRVERVVVLQRTPQWIVPVSYYFDPVAPEVHWLWKHVPFYFDWCRTRSGWNFNDSHYPALVKDPEWEYPERSVNSLNDYQRRYFLEYMESKLRDRPDLVAKSTPDYPPFGKRILLDNGWYDALLKPTVQLEPDGLAGLTETSVISTSGQRFDVDTVVLCTGFQTSRYLYPLDITGRDGIDLRGLWQDDDAFAYLGIMTPMFPNLFYMYGPGTNAGGGSFVTLAESQIRYIMQMISALLERDAKCVEPRSDITADYNTRMDEANSKMVWSHPGMTTYVRNSKGRVTVNMPWRIVDYWTMMSAPNTGDYVFDADASGRDVEETSGTSQPVTT
jgi:4-hydroxyacetophenone monooxygenase